MSEPIKTLSLGLKEVATTPSDTLTEKYYIMEDELDCVGAYRLVNGPQDLIHTADRRLVFQINGSIKVGDFFIDRFAHHISLCSMDKRTHS